MAFGTVAADLGPGSPRPRRRPSSRPSGRGRIAPPGSSGTSSGSRSRSRPSGECLVRHGLHRLGLPPVKPVERFVAGAPNALWQIDLMGRVRFPLPGDLYLILALDDHSRFSLAGGFFPRQFRVRLFTVMHAAFSRWGLPQALLSDRGSRFKSTSPIGEADYPYYARRLGIDLVYARRARTKGKIERLFQFIQRDFVLEELEATSVAAVNASFAQLLEAYNFGHASRALDGDAPAAHYVPSTRRLRGGQLDLEKAVNSNLE